MARLLWLLPVGLLQACAGTPVAEQLESSFPVPNDRPAQVAASVPASKTSQTITSPAITSPAITSPATERSPEPAPNAASRPDPLRPQESMESVPEDTTRSAVSQPQPKAPYRITIRVAGADPAAPAEAVTRALREADVGFAVERIERVEP